MQVYKDQSNVDNYLVQSIVQPTSDPKAAEVYYRYFSFLLIGPRLIAQVEAKQPD